MIFCVCWIPRKFDIKSLYICPSYLHTVATLPWEILNIYLYILQITYVISEENKLLPPYVPHEEIIWSVYK